jgi:hypothetical protein
VFPFFIFPNLGCPVQSAPDLGSLIHYEILQRRNGNVKRLFYRRLKFICQPANQPRQPSNVTISANSPLMSGNPQSPRRIRYAVPCHRIAPQDPVNWILPFAWMTVNIAPEGELVAVSFFLIDKSGGATATAQISIWTPTVLFVISVNNQDQRRGHPIRVALLYSLKVTFLTGKIQRLLGLRFHRNQRAVLIGIHPALLVENQGNSVRLESQPPVFGQRGIIALIFRVEREQ